MTKKTKVEFRSISFRCRGCGFKITNKAVLQSGGMVKCPECGADHWIGAAALRKGE